MDFRSLIGKLEKIEQRQLLQESTNVAEQILSEDLANLKEAYINLMERLNYKINVAASKIDNEDERKKFLGNAAAKNGYPGLFDPITGKFVDSTGEYAWFGAYKSEIEQMERDGLIPEKARTEALLGLMGKEHDAAYNASQKVATKDQMVDTATEIIAKGRQSWDPTINSDVKVKESKRGSLAQAITESFGYTFEQIVESITREEHKQLKTIIAKLQDYKDDPDVTRLLNSYDEYVKIRGIIIGKIDAILAKLQALRSGTALKESREMLREEIFIFGDKDSNQYSALTLYYDANGNVSEYLIQEGFADDVSDFGRGAGQSLTFGYSDNIVAGITSMFKGTKYADELKKELQATAKAKERSPYLYGAGYVAGMVPYFVTGTPGVIAGAAGLVSDLTGVRDKHNLNTLMAREKELADKKSNTQSDQKPATRLQRNPEVEKLQKLILQKDPNALPVHGVDGKLGPETLGAAKRLGIALPSTTVKAAAEVDPEVSNAIMTKLGAKDPTSAVTALNAKIKANGGDVAKTIAQLAGIEPEVAKESIMYSSMTENERMSYLLNKLTILEGIEALGRPIISMLELAAGKGTAAVMAALVKAIPNIASKGVVIAGERWAPIAGQVGKFSNGKGAVMEAEQILHYITNTSTVGDTILVAGKNYQKTASGWTEAGKAKVLPKAEQEGIEQAWAKTHGKDPHAPAPKPAGGEPGAPTPTTPAPAPAPTTAPIPPGKISQWVQTKYPKLYNISTKLVKAGTVPVKFLSNNKWWAALAAVIAWGYIWPGISDNTTDDNSDQKIDVNPNVVTPGAEDEKRRQEAEYKTQLDQLIKMLQEMFPDDQEALDAIARAQGATGGSGSDQKADTSKLSKPGWDTSFKGVTGGGDISGHKAK